MTELRHTPEIYQIGERLRAKTFGSVSVTSIEAGADGSLIFTASTSEGRIHLTVEPEVCAPLSGWSLAEIKSAIGYALMWID